MMETRKLTDYIKPLQGVAEELGIGGIKREVTGAERYASWLARDAERTPWRFDDTMLSDIKEAISDLNVTIMLVATYRKKMDIDHG